MLSGHILPFRCTECGIELIRIVQPLSADFVVCIECRGIGNYNKVIHKGHNLIRGALTDEEVSAVLSQVKADEELPAAQGHILQATQ